MGIFYPVLEFCASCRRVSNNFLLFVPHVQYAQRVFRRAQRRARQPGHQPDAAGANNARRCAAVTRRVRGAKEAVGRVPGRASLRTHNFFGCSPVSRPRSAPSTSAACCGNAGSPPLQPVRRPFPTFLVLPAFNPKATRVTACACSVLSAPPDTPWRVGRTLVWLLQLTFILTFFFKTHRLRPNILSRLQHCGTTLLGAPPTRRCFARRWARPTRRKPPESPRLTGCV